MTLVKTNHPGFMMDTDTGVIINSDTRELTSYRSQVEQFLELRDLKDDFKSVREELQELRRLMANK